MVRAGTGLAVLTSTPDGAGMGSAVIRQRSLPA
jgi:hypothetical protein